MNEQNVNAPQPPVSEPMPETRKKSGIPVLLGLASFIVIIAALAILYSQQNLSPKEAIDTQVSEMDKIIRNTSEQAFEEPDTDVQETTLPEPDESQDFDTQIESFSELEINWDDATLDDAALNDIAN